MYMYAVFVLLHNTGRMQELFLFPGLQSTSGFLSVKPVNECSEQSADMAFCPMLT